MKLTLEQSVFDVRGNLKLMPNERLLAKKKLLCMIYLKGLLLKKGFTPATIFYSDPGFIYRTDQRIVCTKILDEGVVEDDVCIEVPLDEIIVCRRSIFRLTLVCRDFKSDTYFIELIPRKSAKKFLGEVQKIHMRCNGERKIIVSKQ
ncbi:MAG: hypothetical protein JSV56_11455 [Methanomassiliicoccales archaeon]|nr:MAG: hypothetical protein JSV56_11455 [Methanomassiliicoccales archaeon]